MKRPPLHHCFAAFLFLAAPLPAIAQTLQQYLQASDSCYYKGDWNNTLLYGEKALQVIARDSGKLSHAYARTTDQTMGYTYEKKGDYIQALHSYRNSIDIYKQTGAAGTTDYGDALVNLGNLYTIIGAYTEAEKPLQEARQIFKDTPLYEGYGAATSNLGNVYNYEGKYAAAALLYREALELVKNLKADEAGPGASVYNNLASVYSKIGNYDKALQAVKKAMVFYRSADKSFQQNYVTSLLNEATIFVQLDKTDSAANYVGEALSVVKDGADSYLQANTLNMAAALQMRKKNYPEAETFYKKAMATCYNADSFMTSTYYNTASNLAFLYYTTGRHRQADSLFQIIFRTIYRLGKPDYRSLNNLYQQYCSFLIANKRFQEAADSLQSLGRQTHAFIGQNFAGMSEDEKLSLINTLYKNFDLQYTLLSLYKGVSPGFIQHAFSNALLLKGLVLFNQSAIIRAVSKSNDSRIKAAFDKWLFLKQLLATQYGLSLRQRTMNTDSLQELANSAEKEFGGYEPVKKALLPYRENSLKAIAGSLNPDEAVIEFVRFNDRVAPGKDNVLYGAFVFNKKDTIPHFVLLCSEARLKQLMSKTKGSSGFSAKIYPVITSKQTIATGESTRLYQLLWKPLLPLVAPFPKVYYSPAGLLYYVSFNAISNNGHGVLLDRHNLLALYSINDLLLSRNTISPLKVSLWGNMDYNEADTTASPPPVSVVPGAFTINTKGYAGRTWPALTTKELDDLKTIFRQKGIACHTFEGRQAGEGLFKNTINGFEGVVHLSTHGFYAPDPYLPSDAGPGNIFTGNVNPMFRCGLIFSGANRVWSGGEAAPSKDDGILTGYEIAELDLSKTGLVTLSACETGLGKIADYEGIFGLQRAFKMAGANKLLVSLWQVPAKETAELMKLFYDKWLNNSTPPDALIAAQKQLRKKYAPYYWAGFVLLE